MKISAGRPVVLDGTELRFTDVDPKPMSKADPERLATPSGEILVTFGNFTAAGRTPSAAEVTVDILETALGVTGLVAGQGLDAFIARLQRELEPLFFPVKVTRAVSEDFTVSRVNIPKTGDKDTS